VRPAYVPSWGRGFVGARPRQHRRCLRSAIRLALPGEPTMRRDSAGAATQTWAVCMRAAHAWACVLRNCISVCACVRHGPGARVPVRLSMPRPHPLPTARKCSAWAALRIRARRSRRTVFAPPRTTRLNSSSDFDRHHAREWCHGVSITGAAGRAGFSPPTASPCEGHCAQPRQRSAGVG
jgi:hypothetical protein